MSGAQETLGPALPWANNAPAIPPSHVTAISINDRIEVRWQLEEDEGAPVVKWWGATVLEVDQASNRLKIRYDGTNGFEPEEANVEVLSTEYLRQVGSEDELRWKREGTVVEESDSEHEPRDAVLSLAELTEEQAEIERTMEEEALQQLSENLQPAQQAEVLSRFQDFAEHFRGHLQQLAQENQNRIITEDDIHNIRQSFGRS